MLLKSLENSASRSLLFYFRGVLAVKFSREFNYLTPLPFGNNASACCQNAFSGQEDLPKWHAEPLSWPKMQSRGRHKAVA